MDTVNMTHKYISSQLLWIWLTSAYPHRYCKYDSKVHILTGTVNMTYRYISSRVLWIWLTGTYPHGYCEYDPQVHILTGTVNMTYRYIVHILTGTVNMTYRYISSRVLWTWLTGTYPHGYCEHDSQVHILTGTVNMTHRYISSQVHILTGTVSRTHRYIFSVPRVWLMGTYGMTHGHCKSSQVLRILTSSAFSLYKVFFCELRPMYVSSFYATQEWQWTDKLYLFPSTQDCYRQKFM